MKKLVLEKSVSKSQQKLFGMVHACQKGEKCDSPEVEKVAKSIKPDDAEDFAATHKGLPEKKEDKKDKKKKMKTFKEWMAEKITVEGLLSKDEADKMKQDIIQRNKEERQRMMDKVNPPKKKFDKDGNPVK